MNSDNQYHYSEMIGNSERKQQWEYSHPLLNVRTVYLLVKERWQLGVAIGLICSVLFTLYFLQKVPIYEAETTFLIKFKNEKVIQIDRVVDESFDKNQLEAIEVLNNHITQLMSRNFLEYALKDYNRKEALLKPWSEEELFSLNTKKNLDATIIIRENILSVSKKRSSHVIQLHVRHNNPSLASQFANHLIKKYISYKFDSESTSNQGALSFLDQQANKLKHIVEVDELELLNYRKKHNLISLEESQSIALERVAKINSALSELTLKTIELRSKLDNIKNGKKQGLSLIDFQEISSFGSIKEILLNIDEEKAERAELNAKYLELHPAMVANEMKLNSLKNSLDRNIEQAIADLENKMINLENQRKSLLEKLTSVESNLLRYSQMRIESNIIRRKLENDQKSYEQLMIRLNETKISSQLDVNNVRVLDYAIPPEMPVFPKKELVFAGSILLFIFITLGLPISIGLYDNRIKTRHDIEIYLKQSFLCSITNVKDIKNGLFDEDVGQMEALRETFLHLYTNLQLMGKLDAGHTIMTCSSVSGEGKTFTNTNLAYIYAKQGFKALIIDCDLRRPSIHKRFNIKNDAGIIKWFTDSKHDLNSLASNDELGIQKVSSDYELYVLRAGGSTKHPFEIFDSTHFINLINACRSNYDIIFIDTPPAKLFPDALLLAKYSDQAVFICKHNHLNRNKAMLTIEKLQRSSIKIAGIVLNQVKSGTELDNNYDSYSNKEYNAYYKQKR